MAWEGLHASDGTEGTEERTPWRTDGSTNPRNQQHLALD